MLQEGKQAQEALNGGPLINNFFVVTCSLASHLTRCAREVEGTQVGREHEDPVLTEYARLAGQYDRRWSFYLDATTRETLKRLCPRPGDELLDVGCGTGTFLQALASAFPRVKLTGVDPSSAMLDFARAKLGPAAELKPGRAERLPFLDEAFDVVVSTSTFHYLRRPDEALHEIARVLNRAARS